MPRIPCLMVGIRGRAVSPGRRSPLPAHGGPRGRGRFRHPVELRPTIKASFSWHLAEASVEPAGACAQNNEPPFRSPCSGQPRPCCPEPRLGGTKSEAPTCLGPTVAGPLERRERRRSHGYLVPQNADFGQLGTDDARSCRPVRPGASVGRDEIAMCRPGSGRRRRGSPRNRPFEVWSTRAGGVPAPAEYGTRRCRRACRQNNKPSIRGRLRTQPGAKFVPGHARPGMKPGNATRPHSVSAREIDYSLSWKHTVALRSGNLRASPAARPGTPRATPRSGCQPPMHGYSLGVSRFLGRGALLGRFGRCYPSRAPDAGTLAGTFGGFPEEQVERSNPAPHSGVRGPSHPGSVVVRLPLTPGRGVGDSYLSSRRSTI